jgi:hypothetical protein
VSRRVSIVGSNVFFNLSELCHSGRRLYLLCNCARWRRRCRNIRIFRHTESERLRFQSESLFYSEVSFVTGREFAMYENKSHPKQSLYLVVTQRSPDERLVSCFTCCKTRYEHLFVDRDVVTVNTNRNYVF